MYRDDKNAMAERLDALSREALALRRDNEAMRQTLLRQRAGNLAPVDPYLDGPARLTPGERAALSHHGLTRFPTWATGILSAITFGLFPLIHFSLMHDRLPVAAHNDPSAGKAIGFSFIPYFNLYWVFFNSMRLADRLNLQLRLRGEDASWLRGLMIACSVLSVIPYINLFFGLPLWIIGACLLQSTVNRVAALDPLARPVADPALAPPNDPYALPPPGLIK